MFYFLTCFSSCFPVVIDSLYSSITPIYEDPVILGIMPGSDPGKRSFSDILFGDNLYSLGVDVSCSDMKKTSKKMTINLTKETVNMYRELIAQDYRYYLKVGGIKLGTKNKGSILKKGTRLGLFKDAEVMIRSRIESRVVCGSQGETIIGFECNDNYEGDYIVGNAQSSMEFEIIVDVTKEISNKSPVNRDPEYSMNSRQILHSLQGPFFMTSLLVFISLYIYLSNRPKDTKDSNTVDIDYDVDLSGEYRWKLLHGDVFRPPQLVWLLPTLVGSGFQHCMCIFLTFFGQIFKLYSISSFSSFIEPYILIYFFFSVISGFYSSKVFKTIAKEHWRRHILFSGLFFCVLLLFIVLFNHTIFRSSATTYNQSVLSIVKNLMTVFVGSFILHSIGSIISLQRMPYELPTDVNQIPRHIPNKSDYLHLIISSIVCGFSIFNIIAYDLHCLLESSWSSISFFDGYLRIFISFIIMVVASGSISTISTYILLSKEDFRWWWYSFISPAFTGIIVFIYQIWYCTSYVKPIELSSLICYINLSLLSSIIISLVCGFSGFFASFAFVRGIYESLKIE